MHILHIPKTGGTAIKYAIEGMPDAPVSIIDAGHNFHLNHLSGPCMIILRDPLERFCSAFWERKTMLLRKAEADRNSYRSFGYALYSPGEKRVLDVCNEPNDFVRYLRTGNSLGHHDILAELTASITRWIGNMENYLVNEGKIAVACDIENLTAVMQKRFGITLPTDPFRKRSRQLFDIEQSYELDADNLKWFKTVYRKLDYDINAYIRSRHYYVK